MNFSLEIGQHTDIDILPTIKDVYITLLPGGDYVETTKKAGDLVKKGFKFNNPNAQKTCGCGSSFSA